MSDRTAHARSVRREILARLHMLPPHPVPREHIRLLWLVGAAMIIANYDVYLYGLAMHQIQTEFAVPEQDISKVNALFRLGVIPAMLLAYAADMIGRRTLLMVTLAGATAATIWTGFSQSIAEFTLAQSLARVFIYTEELLCVVVIAEELDERVRGWGIGVIGAFGALGNGTAALVFGFIAFLPFGWRALYFVAALPLLWLLWARRRLPETRRFAQEKHNGVWRPFIGLVTEYPKRLALVVTMAVLMSFGAANAVIFIPKVLQSTHGWQPSQVAALTIIGGILAIFGTTFAGALSDRYGRRAVLTFALSLAVVSFALFYTIATGPLLVVLWITAIFAFLMTDVLIGALSAELFPTSHRALASATRLLFSILGGAAGLLLEGQLYAIFQDHGTAITVLMIPIPLALIPIWFLPEPAKKPLEEIAAERMP